MDLQIWATTAAVPDYYHAFPSRSTALCSNDVRISAYYTNAKPWPMRTGVELATLPFAAKLCRGCYTLASQRTEGATMPKTDITTKEGKDALDTISADTERVRTLRGEGNEDSARALAAETRLLIGNLSGKGSIKARQDAGAALAEAETAELGTAVADPSDYATYEGVPDLVSRGAERAKEGVAVGTKMADIAREIAEVTVAIRLSVPGRGGLPDLEAQSGPYKSALAALYADVERSIGEDETGRQILGSLKRSVQFQASRQINAFLLALDTSDEADVRAYFPTLPADAAKTGFNRAVYALYEAAGISLPTKGMVDSDSSSGSAPAELTLVQQARAALDNVVKKAAKLSPVERTKVQQDLTAMATALIAEAAKLGEATKAEKSRERATERVRAVLAEVAFAPETDSAEGYREAAERLLSDREDVSAAQLAKVDWEALYEAYTAA